MVPERAPDWFLVATEACGGGTPNLGYFLEVSVFIGIFGVGLTSGGGLRVVHEIGGTPTPLGAPSTLVGPSRLPRPTSFAYILPYTLKTSESIIDREFRRQKPL